MLCCIFLHIAHSCREHSVRFYFVQRVHTVSVQINNQSSRLTHTVILWYIKQCLQVSTQHIRCIRALKHNFIWFISHCKDFDLISWNCDIQQVPRYCINICTVLDHWFSIFLWICGLFWTKNGKSATTTFFSSKINCSANGFRWRRWRRNKLRGIIRNGKRK